MPKSALGEVGVRKRLIYYAGAQDDAHQSYVFLLIFFDPSFQWKAT